ncbi:MAG: RtcB family protein [Candidatus Coatesbacteria bacterium]|nr:RtcB family protein [Candidatus Coatesbacteria bacterium]
MKQINQAEYRIEPYGDMRVPVNIFANKNLLQNMEKDKAIEQAINVSTLPGIIYASLMLPDAHQGYGFPIGGVAAFDYHDGIITPGGIGFDINCGIRLIGLNMEIDDIKKDLKMIHSEFFRQIPVGLGPKSSINLSKSDLNDILTEGARWVVKNGMGLKEDLENSEENGCMEGADSRNVSERAKDRGINQLGTLGAGNHFIELQKVEEIFDTNIASSFGIVKKNQVTISIHTGSRGLGHEVCSDYLRILQKPGKKTGLKDGNLIYAESKSLLAKEYFSAMKASANFAWANRQAITHFIRKVLGNFQIKENEIKVIYDIAHNIAKIEKHFGRKVFVHRKGATRALPAFHEDLPIQFRETGHPVLMPGSMGTSSYILVGVEGSLRKSIGSCAHGAGRLMSRKRAKQTINQNKLVNELKQKGIELKTPSLKGTLDEAPEAYKDIEEVVEICILAGLVKPVARMMPVLVIKG